MLHLISDFVLGHSATAVLGKRLYACATVSQLAS